MNVISRADARAAGLKRFFTNAPCKHGHISERYVSIGSCAQCLLENCQKWNLSHRDYAATQARRRNAANPEACRRRDAKWTRENYQRKLANNRNYRARQKEAAGSHTADELGQLLIDQQHLCANPYCRTDLRFVAKQADHIVPLKKRGSNRIANLQWLCLPCNRRKSFLDLEVWLKREAQRVLSVPA